MDINFRPRPILAGYEIGSVIGIGTYGEVRVGKHLSTGQRVAVKIVDLSRFEQETAAIMVKEIDILRSIDHPHVVRIIDVIDKVSYTGKFCSACACTEYSPMLGTGECMNCAPHDGHDHSFEETRQVMLLVQDLAVGGELFGLLMHTGPFPEEIARYYFQQLISGLEFLHNRGVIHRDLKPENLVLDGQFQLKIVDFGLAAHVADNSQAVLHSGVGSAPYSAPEVFYAKELYQSRGYNGRAADLWSCAVILFVMLTGRPPFVRPLARTYAPHLKRCKHFINILRGQGYGNIGTAAKTFLSKLFQLDARDRLTIEQIKHDEWFQGPVPSFDVLCGAMEEKANAVWMAVQKPQMLELLAKQRADLLHTPVFAPLRAPVAPTLLHSLSAEDRARLPQDPFQHANVDVSLLSLEERAASPVYRSLPIQMFQAEGDLEFDYLAHKRSGLDSHAHCGADEWLADADCNLGPCCGKDKSYLQSGWSLSEHLGEDENEESDHERDCEEAEDSDYHPSPNQYRFTGQPLENKSAGGEVFETHPHCHASSPSLDSLPQFPEAPALAQWLNPPVNLVSESAPDGLLLTRAPPVCWPATESVAQYSRMIFQQPAADVLAQFTHRLNVLGISHRSLPGDSLYLNGAFSGSPLTAVISVRACAHQPAFVGVEFNRIRGDPITFHQFARFVARLA